MQSINAVLRQTGQGNRSRKLPDNVLKRHDCVKKLCNGNNGECGGWGSGWVGG